MQQSDVERWMKGYLKAWESNDPQDIGSLFTDDAAYYTAPDRDPWRGRDAIVEGWLGRKDERGDWSFRYEITAVCDDVAFVRGWTEYRNNPDYSNLWVIRLDESGRCPEYMEWWMEIEGSPSQG